MNISQAQAQKTKKREVYVKVVQEKKTKSDRLPITLRSIQCCHLASVVLNGGDGPTWGKTLSSKFERSGVAGRHLIFRSLRGRKVPESHLLLSFYHKIITEPI